MRSDRGISVSKRLVVGALGMLAGSLSNAAEPGPVSAATNTVATLPPIVVTATRDARQPGDTPHSTAAIDNKALRLDAAPRTLPDALKNEPGTMVQKTAHGQGSPAIRGFTGYRTLFLIDGVRLNNSVFRDGPNQYWNTVDALGLNRVEIARGPYSVLYGSDAIGGTVQAFTHGAQDLAPGVDWQRQLYYRYGSAEAAHIGRAEVIGKPTADLALSLGYTLKNFGDVKGGREVGTQPKTGYDERDWDAKLESFIDEDASLTLAHQGVEVDDAWRTHKTVYAIDWKGLTKGDELHRILDQDRDLTYLQYHDLSADGFADEVHAGISHHFQAERQDRLRTGSRRDIQGFDVNTLGAFTSFKTESAIGDLVYGAETYHDRVSSLNQTLKPDGTTKSYAIQGPVADDATYDQSGLYLQDDIPVAKRLNLSLGSRYDHVRADAKAVQDPLSGKRTSLTEDWDDVVGSARLLYALDAAKSCHLFTGVSQGFRAPNLSDLSRLDTARTAELETPSPDLEAEHFIAYEAGIKSATAEQAAQLAYFYTDVDGMIVRTPTGRIIDGNREVTKKNGGDGYVQGVELDGRRRIAQNYIPFGTFTWMDGKVDTYPTSEPVLVREYIDRLMPSTGRLGLRWEPSHRYWVEGACTMAAKADRLSTADKADTSRIPPGGTPGYSVYDLRAGWNVCSATSVTLAIENLADEDYRVHGSGVNEPGRNVLLSMQSTF